MKKWIPEVGHRISVGDGSYRLYTGPGRGWIVCDDKFELDEELDQLTNGKVRADDDEEN